MTPLDFLQELRILLIRNGGLVGNIEMTSGNYDDSGNLINGDIPTITTDLCEIGIYGDVLYFVVIALSSTFTENAFDSLRTLPNIRIYGFKEPNKTLYPAPAFIYGDFKKKTLDDEYLQMQFNYGYGIIDPQGLLNEYHKIKDLLANSGMKVVNQLDGTPRV